MLTPDEQKNGGGRVGKKLRGNVIIANTYILSLLLLKNKMETGGGSKITKITKMCYWELWMVMISNGSPIRDVKMKTHIFLKNLDFHTSIYIINVFNINEK